MKNFVLSASALVLTLSMATAPAFAQDTKAATRDANQQQRIEQGESSGALTTRESGRLEKQEGRIDAREAKASSDGTVTKREQHGINRAQNRESARIYNQKHDAQTSTTTTVQ